MKGIFTDINIKTTRLIIRPFSLDDAAQLNAVVSQEAVVKYLPEDVMSLDEVKDILTWLLDCYRKNTPENILKFTVAIEWKADHRVIGWCGLGPLDFRPSQVELFFGLSDEFWGRGIATEAAAAMLAYGFETIGLPRIVAVVHPENVASKRVIEKLRMPCTGRVTGLPEEHRFYEGCLQYELTRDEYVKGNNERR